MKLCALWIAHKSLLSWDKACSHPPRASMFILTSKYKVFTNTIAMRLLSDCNAFCECNSRFVHRKAHILFVFHPTHSDSITYADETWTSLRTVELLHPRAIFCKFHDFKHLTSSGKCFSGSKLFRWHINKLKSQLKVSSSMPRRGGGSQAHVEAGKNNFAPLKYEIWVDNNNNKHTLSCNNHKNINLAIQRPFRPALPCIGAALLPLTFRSTVNGMKAQESAKGKIGFVVYGYLHRTRHPSRSSVEMWLLLSVWNNWIS